MSDMMGFLDTLAAAGAEYVHPLLILKRFESGRTCMIICRGRETYRHILLSLQLEYAPNMRLDDSFCKLAFANRASTLYVFNEGNGDWDKIRGLRFDYYTNI